MSWKCMEVCAALRRGAQLRRSDLREHFYKSCSELREDPTSGAVRTNTIIVMVYKCALACVWDSYQRPQRCESSNPSILDRGSIPLAIMPKKAPRVGEPLSNHFKIPCIIKYATIGKVIHSILFHLDHDKFDI